MPEAQVEVVRTVPLAPEAAWALMGDFHNPWHPAFDRFEAGRDQAGAPLRSFTMQGEAGLYRERQTYVSDSDRVLAYRMEAGIESVRSYGAELRVEPEGEGARVSWTARVEADEPRLSAIARGTEAVFRDGIDALVHASPRGPVAPPVVAETPAPIRDERVEGDPRLAIRRVDGPGPRGRPDGLGDTVAILLHGIGGAAWNWDAQLAALGAVMPAVALDLRGYGGSEPGAGQSTVEDHCADILRVAGQIGPGGRILLVGLSFGAWIATSFAMRHPDRLAGLVLSGGCTGMSEASPAERDAFRAAREVPLDQGLAPRDFAPAVVAMLAGPSATPAVRQALLDSMAAIPAATYRDALGCFTRPTERFDFARLTMPVLMMTGAFDRLAPPDEIRGVARRIAALSPRPDVRFEVIPDAGHLCNLERPDAYNRHLLAFARRLA